jgi:two-component system phosphate regulon sensor histidine kinase PhoR
LISRFGMRGALFIVLMLLTALVSTAVFSLVNSRFREQSAGEFRDGLMREALALSEAAALAEPTVAAFDGLADRLAQSSGHRVSLFSSTGKLLGDSTLTAAEIRAQDDQATRAEVATALAGEPVWSRRYSPILETEMLFAAAPVRVASGVGGVARVSVDTAEVGQGDSDTLPPFVWLALLGLVALNAGLAYSIAQHLTPRAVSGGGRRSLPPGGGADDSFSRVNRELQETLAELSDQRTRFETVLESMGEALVALDSELKITLLNPAAIELLELDQSVVGKDLVAVNRAPGLNELAERGLSEAASAEFDLPGSARRRVLARATPLAAGEGTVVNLHDVTDMRRLERIRRDFVANVSHELRTPVAIIRANAETLMNGGFEDAKRGPGFVNAIHRNSERLAQLIAELLDLSRMEAGSYRLVSEPQNVAEAAARSVAEIGTFANERELTVETRLPEDLWVIADSKALDQILLNLVHNAVKYTGVGSHVVVEAEAVGDNVVISVGDNGPGIAAHHRARIFERFYRIDAGRARDVGGTGLGLAIVKHLVESMNGSVSVEANEPQGTVFRVVLPNAADEGDWDGDSDEGVE